MDLVNKKCVPCEGKLKAMSITEEGKYIREHSVAGWTLVREGTHKLQKTFVFDDFIGAMAFVNKVARVAEEEGHHPDIYIYYNKVVLELYTHAVKGLFENDFILAAKINALAG